MPERPSTKTGTLGADTTFLIDFFKGEERAVAFMRAHARVLRVSELVIYEFLCGRLSARDEALFFDAMASFPSLEFNREAALLASEIFRGGQASGRTPGHRDTMIAGTYLAHGVRKIVTRDVAAFQNMSGIEVESY
jgi:predicted nucleic acid-binding protein